MGLTQNLVVDIGNTRSKIAVFQADVLLEQTVIANTDTNMLNNIITRHQPVYSILSSVGEDVDEIKKILKRDTQFLELTHNLPLPFTNRYLTPQTLGMDRIAGIAGAQFYFSEQNCLVIDMGTCVTYDFITAGSEYRGGAISPGLNMRLKAMAQFTKRLPDLVFEKPEGFIGGTTKDSMLSGVYYGLLGEINDTIERYEGQFGTIQVLVCGGDGPIFDKHTKKSIFAAPDLVLYGLNKLLRYNAN
jgi:type III pantothenate kinase